jgi:hypothetical protein
MAAPWRVASSLNVLLGQLNVLAPRRSKASDGSIGDADHASRDSDHNPWYGPGIVTARDFTHDPAGGLDCQWLANVLVANRDPRIKYIIWNRRIWQGSWRAYSGTNPHTKHLHLSVVASPANDSTSPWAGINAAPPSPPPEEDVDLNDPMRAFIWPHNDAVRDTVGSVLGNTQSYAAEAAANTRALLAAHGGEEMTEAVYRRIVAEELAKRPVTADVDEAALAAELDARGIGGVTAAELIQILASTRLVPTPEGNPS